jgi:hypothetical protein
MNWNFKEYPNRHYKWEAYYSPQGPEMRELYAWCWQTFGHTGVNWDNHGGWIKLKGDEELIMFKLRWS